MSSKTIDWTKFTNSKEYDASLLDQTFQGSGLKFVTSIKGVRFLARFVFQSKKISKSLGSFTYDQVPEQLDILRLELAGFRKAIAENQHPFEVTTPTQKLTLSNFVRDIYLPNAKSRKSLIKMMSRDYVFIYCRLLDI